MNNFKQIEIEKIDILMNKITHFFLTTEKSLLEREELVRLIALALISKEHVFMYGPPGTAKSAVSTALKNLTKSMRFFSYLMTDFTKFEEIFGEMISKENGLVSQRELVGKLPDAQIAFLDEVFKGSAAILNALLTILNEKLFDDGYNGRISVDLNTVLAASNEFPRTSYLNALFERFIFRIPVPNVILKKNRYKLIKGDFEKLGELVEVNKDEINYILDNFEKTVINDNELEMIDLIINTMHSLLNSETSNDGMETLYEISGRTQTKAGRIMRISAYLNKRTSVDVSDILLLKYIIWNNLSQRQKVLPKLNNLLFSSEKEIHGDCIKEIEILCGYIYRYMKSLSPILNYNTLLQNSNDLDEFSKSLKKFNSEFKVLCKTLNTIDLKLEENKIKEKLVDDNIFIYSKNALDWRVEDSLIAINSQKFADVVEFTTDFECCKITSSQKTYRLKPVLQIMFTIHDKILEHTENWLLNNESFLFYKINRDK